MIPINTLFTMPMHPDVISCVELVQACFLQNFLPCTWNDASDSCFKSGSTCFPLQCDFPLC